MSEKMLTWKVALKRILPVVIAVLSIIVIAVIFASVKSSSPNPEISDKDSSYLTIGGYKVSKERLYTYLRKNYGVSELANLVDKELLKDTIAELDKETNNGTVIEYVIETLFDVEYKEGMDLLAASIEGYHQDPKEVWDDLKDTLVLYGSLTEETVKDDTKVKAAIVDYYKLDCARDIYARKYYNEMINKVSGGNIFTDAQIQDYYDKNYGGSSTGLYIPFDSEEQALRVMKEIGGINTHSSLLDDKKGWISADFDPSLPESATNVKHYMTVSEVMDAYIKMYNYMMINYNSGVKPLQGEELYTTKISAEAVLEDVVEAFDEFNQKDVVAKSFKLPSEIKLVENGTEKGKIEVTWEIANYSSSDTDTTQVELSSEKDSEGNYVVTIKDLTKEKRINLTAKFKYEDHEQTKKIRLDLQANAEAGLVEVITLNEVEVQYALDKVEGFTSFTPAEGASDIVKFNWKYTEINEIDSTVANYLKYDSTKLSINQTPDTFYKQYTAEPVKGTNYYFLIIKFAEKADKELVFETDENYNDYDDTQKAEFKALIEEIKTKLSEDLITDNDITRILFENRTKNGLVIYDRYLEAVYQYSYNKFFDSTIAVTNYLPFVATDKSSKTVVAEVKFGDQKFEITADDLYAALESKYGVLTAASIIDDYLILTNKEFNDVYNPYTGEIMDEEAYKEALKSEIATIRKNFEYGYFANAALENYGLIPAFGADYGWKNFKEDYFSAFSDAELIANRDFGGSVYTEASTAFSETLYSEIEKVWAEIEKAYGEYYSVDVMNLVISLDVDFDGTPDSNIVDDKVTGFEEKSPWTTELQDLAKELAAKFVELAPQTGATTLTSQMSALVEIYNKAVPVYETQAAPSAYDTIYTYNYFGKYKAAGLKLKWEEKATYTNTSSIVEEFSDKLREIYNTIDAQGLVGETITVPYFSDEAFETSYGLHMIAVIGSTAPANKLSKEEAIAVINKHLYVSLTEDEQAEDHDKKAALTADEKAFITSWYTPATQVLGGTNPVSIALIEQRLLDENKALIKFENNQNLVRYETISKLLKESYEEEE